MLSSTLASVRAANASALASAATTKPIALIVGGTSGIGRGVATVLARHTQGNCQILICGRNRAAAEAIIQTFPKSTTGADHAFVQCDASLMKNVHSTCEDLLKRLPKLNYLVMSPGFIGLTGRQDTEEGIDRKFAVHYYARWKFLFDLLPLLRNAKDAGEDARVLSVLSAGEGKEIDLDDLGLKKTHTDARKAFTTSTYNDLMIEEFAEQNPDLVFTHAAPGVVRTPLMGKMHWSMKLITPVLFTLFYPITVSEEECGEYMLHALLQGDKGAYRRNSKGVDIGPSKFTTEEARKKVWEHTIIETGSSA